MMFHLSFTTQNEREDVSVFFAQHARATHHPPRGKQQDGVPPDLCASIDLLRVNAYIGMASSRGGTARRGGGGSLRGMQHGWDLGEVGGGVAFGSSSSSPSKRGSSGGGGGGHLATVNEHQHQVNNIVNHFQELSAQEEARRGGGGSMERRSFVCMRFFFINHFNSIQFLP